MKSDRQLTSRLHACGLEHWNTALAEWLQGYAPLEHIVDNDQDGPRAAVIGLLRRMAKMHSKPSDPEFAELLSGLEFLKYKILRIPVGMRPSVLNAQAWDPARSTLRDFLLDRAYEPAGLPCSKGPLDRDEICRRLLRLLQKKHQCHD